MCKILGITSIKAEHVSELQELTWQSMSQTEKSGYGSAWNSKEGIGYIKKSDVYVREKLPFGEGFFENAKLDYESGAVIIHGRTATCGVNVENTHPFVIDNFALIHNGVVESKKYVNKISTCDSELILRAFMDGGIKAVAEHIEGWYACLIIEKLPDGRHFLHVFKDTWTSLYVGSLDGEFIFATTMELIEGIGGKVLAKFKGDTYCRFEGNQLKHQEDFTSRKGYSKYLEEKSHVALGKGKNKKWRKKYYNNNTQSSSHSTSTHYRHHKKEFFPDYEGTELGSEQTNMWQHKYD